MGPRPRSPTWTWRWARGAGRAHRPQRCRQTTTVDAIRGLPRTGVGAAERQRRVRPARPRPGLRRVVLDLAVGGALRGPHRAPALPGGAAHGPARPGAGPGPPPAGPHR
ncbi:MAG: hypothetical protein MZU95_07400 [Desulfomicrobium escambiense]|nr:hypothetical protein [Desulfomicrobium escambiense]